MSLHAALLFLSVTTVVVAPQESGTLRGIAVDKDFDVPLAGVEVTIVETGRKTITSEDGHYAFTAVPEGRYTVLATKDGYVRVVKADVRVVAGQLTDVDLELAGEFTDLDEFVVEELVQANAGTEAALLQQRFESPALLDSIGSELMSRAGAGDAASALKLVSGASVQDGKFAVIRGLPDRYVSSQINGVRLPSADENTRAVELDLFPSAVIESLQVSKTFTPDQQGDASGGAVDLRLKGIPDQTILQLKTQTSYDSQSTFRDDFLTYDGGGVDFLGRDDGGRDVQTGSLGQNWTGAAGTSTDDAPIEGKFSFTAGGKKELASGVRIGGLLNAFYERDSSYYDNGIDDSYWVTNPGEPLTPRTSQGTPTDGDFKTSLFDVTQGSQSVRWGGLATLGVETKDHALTLAYLYTRSAEDVATLGLDTRGKAYFFPGYDPNNPTGTGNQPAELTAAPYLRTETLEYTERSTGTLQLSGKHALPLAPFDVGGVKFLRPELGWTISSSTADLNQPDKRQFGALFHPDSFDPGFPPFLPPSTIPATWFPYKPAANFNLGNFQRIWKEIEENSEQYTVNVKLPFEPMEGEKGYLKFGVFDDHVDRGFDQDTFSNFGDAGASFEGQFDDPWSAHFPTESHPISASDFDVDYEGEQQLSAWYGMLDIPLSRRVNLIGGARVERTQIGIQNIPEAGATWFPPGATAPVQLNPGDADVDFEQRDVLPSIGIAFEPTEKVTLRASYSETVARQTFKELTPILQQEYLGGPIFIGNPELQMSALKNYDLRCDYKTDGGGLVSVSWFHKDVDDPIEYVQRLAAFDFTTPVNYPSGELSGYEFEVRQDLGRFGRKLQGFSLGANATFIDSEVNLPDDEVAAFSDPSIAIPTTSRDMTNAPEHLYNVYLTWDREKSGLQLALFYTVQGDTLVAGAGQASGNFVPDVYAKEYDTLNFSASQKLGDVLKLQFQAKNLTNPHIEEVYRADVIGPDVTKTSYTKGIEYSLALTATWSF
ncbi:MAG: TonB-dependent receptor [Planctomycetes bacterium]|nr:TonB-dependent receptor [Planctomycetota bacterium]